jgi:Tfp pilus assembly protein PilO
MSSTNKVIVAMLAVTVVAGGFWVLALGPKRQQASDLEATASTLQSTLATDRQEVEVALEARREFPVDYGQLVVLGKAVPAEDETASLLVQLNRVADAADVRFQEIALASAGGEAPTPEPAPASPEAGGAGEPVAPTESAAAALPLGATVGPAGLDVMPYSLKFTGDFSRVADFIHGLDALVKTNNSNVAVNGRLVTIDGFSLGPQQGENFPHLEANFSVTTYLVPAGQGVTAGASPEAPGAATLTSASTGAEGAP